MSNEIINGFHVCSVTHVNESRGFGFAKNCGDVVRFEGRQGWRIVAGKNYPEFTSRNAVAPKEEESILVFVREVKGGWMAEAWGSYQEYKDALGAISVRMQCPKPTPVLLVPILEIAAAGNVSSRLVVPAPAAKPNKPNNTGRDRRVIFNPVRKPATQVSPAE